MFCLFLNIAQQITLPEAA